MYLDGSVLTAGALRLLQLLLNPFITAGLQSVAAPNNGLALNPAAPLVATPAVAPPRQLSGGDLISLLSALGSANPAGSFSSTGSLGSGGPMGSFMSSGSLGSSGNPMGPFMASGSPGNSPMGSFMASGSVGSSSSNPMGPFMASGSPNRPTGSFMASGSASIPSTGSLGAMQSMQSMPEAALMPGSMTVASMPPLPYAPWLVAQPLPAVPNSPNGPVFVPASVTSLLTSSPSSQSSSPSSSPSSSSSGSLASGALSVLEEAIAPYLNASSSSSSSSTGVESDTASPMPMATLISALGSFMSGIRVVAVHFLSSFALMGAVQLVRLVVQNLPIILGVLGLSRASMARVIVDGVTRAQCLERAACLLGQHASSYPSTPGVLRWLRSPDPASPEHPVWRAFRSAAEGAAMQCEAFAC